MNAGGRGGAAVGVGGGGGADPIWVVLRFVHGGVGIDEECAEMSFCLKLFAFGGGNRWESCNF